MAYSNKYNEQFGSKIKLKTDRKVEIHCKNCDSEIPLSDINLNASLAKCTNCSGLFSIKDDSFFLNDRPDRPEVIMPEGTDVLTLNDSLDIRIDWLKSNPKSSLGFMTFFTVMWNGFLAIMAGGFIASGAISNVSFLSIHLAVGLGLIYYLAAIYLNYTDVIVTKDYIEIGQRPIKNPFRPSKQYRSQDVDQLYVSKYVASTTNNKPNYAYALYAKMRGVSSAVTLVKGMNKETQLYLEQEIERYLDIEDRNVAQGIIE